VHQVGNQYIVNSWCTVRKNIKLQYSPTPPANSFSDRRLFSSRYLLPFKA